MSGVVWFTCIIFGRPVKYNAISLSDLNTHFWNALRKHIQPTFILVQRYYLWARKSITSKYDLSIRSIARSLTNSFPMDEMPFGMINIEYVLLTNYLAIIELPIRFLINGFGQSVEQSNFFLIIIDRIVVNCI